MRTSRYAILMALLFYFVCTTLAFADDRKAAEDATKQIKSELDSNQFADVWDNHIAALFKSHMTKQAFMANLSMGRAQVGKFVSGSFVSMTYATSDPSGYTGEIYAFTYLDTYANGKYYDRLVVVKEQDGQFRLAGLFSAPAVPPQ
jgi:hypothetical protein